LRPVTTRFAHPPDVHHARCLGRLSRPKPGVGSPRLPNSRAPPTA